MGKRYNCEYCNKTMVATPAIVKTHNKGIVHQKIVQEHYQQFKDPETILAEEANKNPCVRFASGECKFGPICRFSHYSREELNMLQNYVDSKKSSCTQNQQPSFQDLYQKLQEEKMAKSTIITSDDTSTILYDNTSGVTHMLPWVYNQALDCYGENLPPSIKRIKIEDFDNAHASSWG